MTGGLYDGVLGVLAGLEVVETLNEAGVQTRHPLGVGFFTNEEGARFPPDMMGSGVQQCALSLDEMLAVVGIDGKNVAAELERIGYAGDVEPGTLHPACFLEIHVEQGPGADYSPLRLPAGQTKTTDTAGPPTPAEQASPFWPAWRECS